MHRRSFLAAAPLALGSLTVLPAALGTPAGARAVRGRAPGPGPYGSLDGREPDANGIVLPEGFESRVVATVGAEVAGTGLVLRDLLDGGANLAVDDGWIHLRNHELNNGQGGVTAIRFDAEGEVVSATSVLEGTTRNCAGGVTPWGTWLSCEEHATGQVWECDPTGERDAVARPALGRFSHEAAAIDPESGHVYLTEDEVDGRLYRFTPEGDPTDLSAGVLEAAVVAGDGAVTWVAIDDPSGDPVTTRAQAGAAMPFNGGEGIWFDETFRRILFTTKGDNRVWVLDPSASLLNVLYDAAELGDAAPLTGVDNLTVAPSGDVYVAEDGGNMELVVLTPEGDVAPFLRMTAPEDQSEVTGPAFSPDGTRLLIASYGGAAPLVGRLFEITGPFRRLDETPFAGPTAALGNVPPPEDPDDGAPVGVIAGAGVVALGVVGAALAARRRSRAPSEPDTAATGPGTSR